MTKDKRVRKLNNGAGALLCSKCSAIVKEERKTNGWAVKVHKRRETYPDGLIIQADWDSKEPLYCEKCKNNG